MPSQPYNPLDVENLGESIERRLLGEDLRSLASYADVDGAGIYLLYYHGSFPAYSPISFERSDASKGIPVPIYVGKANPSGGRTGSVERDTSRGTALRTRLRRHHDSIDASSNLDVADFSFRALSTEETWIALGERSLLVRYKPVWNTTSSGFGNNVVGKRRSNQNLSRWDVLHRGRMGSGEGSEHTAEEYREEIDDHFANIHVAENIAEEDFNE